MIIFELGCEAQHRFEGWFASAEEFDGQLARGVLTCPLCGSGEISKIPHAKIARAETAAQAELPTTDSAATHKPTAPSPPAQVVAAIIDHVLRNSEDVGSLFPDEARRIHREEAPARSIRGIASREEAEALLDEGIEVLPLPIPPKSGWN